MQEKAIAAIEEAKEVVRVIGRNLRLWYDI
jgi:hypothetical protein